MWKVVTGLQVRTSGLPMVDLVACTVLYGLVTSTFRHRWAPRSGARIPNRPAFVVRFCHLAKWSIAADIFNESHGGAMGS